MNNMDFNAADFLAKFGSRVVVGVLAFFILLLAASSFSIISPGNTGVIFNLWTGSLRTVPQGIAWRFPFVTQVQSYPTALRTYTMVKRSNEGSAQGDDSIDLPTKRSEE